LALVLGAVVAIAAAQTFEEALQGSAELCPPAEDELCDDQWDSPWDDLCDEMMERGDRQPTIVVARPPLPEAAAPALCPLSKPPAESNEGTTLWAVGTPPNGTYHWDFDEDEHGEYAVYSSTTTGLAYTVNVRYKVDEQEVGPVASGYIRVFNAELTFEGGSSDPQNAVEDDPGFFMAVGPARKALALTVSPFYPHELMPDDFNWETSPRHAPPPYVVSLRATGPVRFYWQAEGGTPVPDSERVWGWKDVGIDDFEEFWPPPAQVYVEGYDDGIATVTLTLTINCPEECQGWYAPPATAQDTVKVNVVEADLDITYVPEAEEEDPGGFVAKGGSRKKIILTARPTTARPVNLDVTAGEGKVEIYSAATGGSPLGNHLEYTGDMPLYLYVQGVAASDDPQDVELTLDAAPPGGEHFTDTVNFTVVGVDLVVAGLGEGEEMNPGAFVQLNTDDDEPNGHPDILDAPSIDEDDLAPMTLEVEPGELDGNVTLDATAGKWRVGVWPTATKTGTQVSLPETWTPGTTPAELHLEGYSASGGLRDVTLELKHTGHGLTVTDTAKVTVAKADMQMTGLPEAEEEYPGGYLCENNDDDDGDGVVDYDDGYNKDGTPGNDDDTNVSENDLVLLTFQKVLPESMTGPVTLSKTDGGSRIKLWTSATKGEGNEVGLPATYQTPAELPETLYVEIELSVESGGGSVEDKVKMTLVTIEVTHIKFDHTAGDSADGIDIRENAGTDISVPEWVKGGQNNPAAYKKATTVGIGARLTAQPADVTTAKVHGVSTDGDGSLGDTEEVTVTFSGGVSSPEYFTFSLSGPTPSAIQKTTTDEWQWKASDIQGSGSPEWDMTSSGPHIIYTVLDTPQSPMPEPWTAVLDYACDWAGGETGEAGAVDAITVGAYNDFGKNYEGRYTHSSGTAMDLTQLMADNWADCRDMSATVHVFTRAIGGTATQVRQIDGPFATKAIDPVGTPGWGTTGWNFHQVAHYSNVYDACLRLDQSDPRIPCNEAINGAYKSDLYDSGTWTPGAPFSYTTVY